MITEPVEQAMDKMNAYLAEYYPGYSVIQANGNGPKDLILCDFNNPYQVREVGYLSSNVIQEDFTSAIALVGFMYISYQY